MLSKKELQSIAKLIIDIDAAGIEELKSTIEGNGDSAGQMGELKSLQSRIDKILAIINRELNSGAYKSDQKIIVTKSQIQRLIAKGTK